MTIVITGASGHLGRLVVEDLKAAGVTDLLGIGRSAERLAPLGVRTATVDYGDQPGLRDAFQGAEVLLFVSGSEVGQRIPQHRNVVEAAKAAGVPRIVYTSAPYADTTKLLLAAEHLATETMIRESGIPFAFLRNGWYTENYTGQLADTLRNGVILGAAGDGRVSTASRADFAAATATVLRDGTTGVFELGGDEGFTMAELAAEITRQSGTEITYRNLPQDEYRQALVGFGLPEPVAEVYADADRSIAAGELFIDSHDLSRLLGRPTTPLAESLTIALKEL